MRDPGGLFIVDPAGPDPARDRLVLFQESALFPWLDVMGNVLFGLKLKPNLNNAARREVAEFYLQLAREAEREVTGNEQQKWLDRIQEEQDNLRLALAWTKDQGDAENERWLSSALWRFWLVRSYVTESFERLQDFLSSSG